MFENLKFSAGLPPQNSAIDTVTEKKYENTIIDKKQKEKSFCNTDEELFSINFNSELHSNDEKNKIANKKIDDPYSMKNYFINHENDKNNKNDNNNSNNYNNNNNYNNDNNSNNNNNNDNFDINIDNDNNVRGNNGTFSGSNRIKNDLARDLIESKNQKLNIDFDKSIKSFQIVRCLYTISHFHPLLINI